MPADITYTRAYGGPWQNSPSTATPITATALTTIEDGIVAATTQANAKFDIDDLASYGFPAMVTETGTAGVYNNRPAYNGRVIFVGTQLPPSGGSTAGGTGQAADNDIWLHKG